MIAMAATKHPAVLGLASDDGMSLELAFEDLISSIPASRVDKALGILGAGGLPLLVDCASNDNLLGTLTAINPSLSIADLDTACGKLEDLAILLLTHVRASRHELEERSDAFPSTVIAAKVFGEEAEEAFESLTSVNLISQEEAERSRKLIRSANRAAKSVERASRRRTNMGQR